MAPPNTQPALPAEGIKTDLEQVFIDSQPRGLLPENQNSNFGLLRKTLVGELQIAADNLTSLFSEMFIQTASDFLGAWEDELGIPRASTGLSVASRRTRLLNRRRIGAFTRTRRRELVEAFIMATFGDVPEFTSSGIPLTSGGIILHSESGAVTSFYTITEDSAFHYTINIVPTVDPDIAGLTRELNWITPSHYSFTITRNP